MFDLDNWQEIWHTITRNRTRSILTGFGVFWGIFMLILLMGVGSGFTGGMKEEIETLDANTVAFVPRQTSEPYAGYRKGRRWQLDSRDLTTVRRKALSVDRISPVIYGPRSDENAVRGLKTGTYTNLGVTPDYFILEKKEILYGRTLNALDVDGRRKVCVIGEEVYQTLFEVDEDPLGQQIRLNGRFFAVVGVVRANSSMTTNTGTAIFLPFTTMQQTFTRGDTFHQLMCTPVPGFTATMVEDEVNALLRENHDIAPNDEKAVGSFSLEREFKMFNGLFTAVDALVLVVGLGALLSGIIGISNIMLVTVRERTREIGVRRALGAAPRNILAQIMSESVVLTAIAGLLGFLLAVGILAAISQAMSGAPSGDGGGISFGPPLISFNLALGAMALLIVSGAVAGLMPTLKALQIKAIDAIRDE